MLDGFTRREIRTSGATIITVQGGKGQPLLLMHGNPFTHLSWHAVAPVLARDFTVVASTGPDRPATTAIVLTGDPSVRYEEDKGKWAESLVKRLGLPPCAETTKTS